MARATKPRIVTVNGVSATLAEHAAAHGIPYTTLTGRLSTGWTPEQALGLAPKPIRRRGKTNANLWSNLQDALPLDTPLNNMWKAMAGELTAEEYLRREGVPSNGYILSSRDD
jgi:hypothetical protein